MPISYPSAPVAQATTDTHLVKRLWQGDLDAMSALYDRYSGLVYTIALRSLGEVTSAEDLTQDVFMILMNRRTYNPNRGALSSYLSMLTRSRAIDRLRAKSTRHKYLYQWQNQPHVPEPGPMDNASQQERHTLVRAALDHLTQQQRQVLELSYYQGQSQSEIAEQLGVPLGTVKSWARRGLLRLRSHLQDQISEEQS
ncbi:MAG: sigma-70 family RNA polymerase sigma factor [Leptolyngbyaceae cyanobacterium]